MAETENNNPEANPTAPSADAEKQVKEFLDYVDKGGEVFIVGPTQRDVAANFTQENIVKFLAGQITLAQLQGMTMEEAYGLAAHGYRYYKEAKYHDARTIFEGLVVCNPYDSYFHTMLGAVYQELDMAQEAMIEYTTAIDLDPNALHAHVNRARLNTEQGKLDEALADLERAVALDPDNRDPATVRARALASALAQAFAEAKKILAASKPGAGQQPTTKAPEKTKSEAGPARSAAAAKPAQKKATKAEAPAGKEKTKAKR
jgi:tetratricopeptide (TPR) repeat protein